MEGAKSLSLLRCCYNSGCNQVEAPDGVEVFRGLDGKQCETVAKLSRCAKCKIALYCSRSCQRGDWKKHKGHCQAGDIPFDREVLKATIRRCFRSHLCNELKVLGEAQDKVNLGYVKLILASKKREVTWSIGGSPALSYDAWQGELVMDDTGEGYRLYRSRSPSFEPKPHWGIRQLGLMEMGKRISGKAKGHEATVNYSKQLHHLLTKRKNRLIIQVEVEKQGLGGNPGSAMFPIGNLLYAVAETSGEVKAKPVKEKTTPAEVYLKELAGMPLEEILDSGKGEARVKQIGQALFDEAKRSSGGSSEAGRAAVKGACKRIRTDCADGRLRSQYVQRAWNGVGDGNWKWRS